MTRYETASVGPKPDGWIKVHFAEDEPLISPKMDQRKGHSIHDQLNVRHNNVCEGFLSSDLLNCFFVLLLQVALQCVLFDDHIKTKIKVDFNTNSLFELLNTHKNMW